MKKAIYIGKTYDRFSPSVTLFYEYRGHEYTVTDHHNGCMETLAEQHKYEQERIDRYIEQESKTKKPYKYEDSYEYGFDLFWTYVNQ